MSTYVAEAKRQAVLRVTCENCDSFFIMKPIIKVTAEGDYQADNKGHLQQEAIEKLEAISHKMQNNHDFEDLEPKACYQCGFYQSWMVKRLKQDEVESRATGVGCLVLVIAMFAVMLVVYFGLGINLGDLGDLGSLLTLLIAVPVASLAYFLAIPFVRQRVRRRFHPNTPSKEFVYSKLPELRFEDIETRTWVED